MGPNEWYERCIFRHVDFERSDEMVLKLEVFLREAVGQRYGFNSSKFLRQKTMHKKNDNNEMIDENRTFFCSELVAKAFKVLGILKDNDISCAKFFPSHFSAKHDKMI